MKAPGRAKSTTLRPAKSVRASTDCQPVSVWTLTRALGIAWPTSIVPRLAVDMPRSSVVCAGAVGARYARAPSGPGAAPVRRCASRSRWREDRVDQKSGKIDY